METVFKIAVREGRVVRLIYLDREGKLTERRVRILQVTSEDLLAWCGKSKDYRRFRRSGILAAEL
ncbi:hypothetical protein [Marininema halotolerans]|uniref:WYL domain-containing protein n=1 Tax=Marininema halotolerans TaxID=1155944 RepID=A0A1I6QPA7_9BACL|nr:hypothetical protein [Marininema halotolerans]SFS54311.1 hypothetical protein SAMN05444972_103289 [Marininema halotolerans]